MVHHAQHCQGEQRQGGGQDVTPPVPLARLDTIAAIATPPGRGGIGVVRVSGAGLADLAKVLTGHLPQPRRAVLRSFREADGGVIDTGILLYFKGPRSFTGEDMLELQGHGGPVVMEALLERVCALGARLARPGEFTERAFLNDKLDLAQAEAVADLIDSASRRAARAAMRSLAGEFSRRVRALDAQVLGLRVFLEAAIDFADEDIDFLADEEVHRRAAELSAELAACLQAARRGQVLRDGLEVVIAGPPNAGKSSLLNRLLVEDRAIVTDVPGTTRDLISGDIVVAGVPIRLTDTAGLRRGGDRVEMIGVERARAAAASADVVLLVVDATAPDLPEHAGGLSAAITVTVRNKVDLTGEVAGAAAGGEVVRISAKTGAGVDALKERLLAAAGGVPPEGVFAARKRHLAALANAVRHVAAAERHVRAGMGDVAAEALRDAQRELGSIVGATSVDDLLGRIFREFCVGK